MKNFITKTLDAAKKYTVWDYAIFKVCLVAIGVILGAYFSEFFINNIAIVWIIAIISYVWIMYKTFVKYRNS